MMPNPPLLKRFTFVALFLSCQSGLAIGDSFRTRNFIATANTADLAKEVGESAESCRRQFALDWFGVELPPWDKPCVIWATVGEQLPARGETSYVLDRERPTLWEMHVQGPRSTLLRSVLRHEVTHAIFATHVGRRLPRCLEEGACVSAEHRHDRTDLEDLLARHREVGKVTTLHEMLTWREDPADSWSSYAESYSLVCFLLAQGGKRKFMDFVTDGVNHTNWALAARTHYGHATLEDLQEAWWNSITPAVPPTSARVAQAAAN